MYTRQDLCLQRNSFTKYDSLPCRDVHFGAKLVSVQWDWKQGETCNLALVKARRIILPAPLRLTDWLISFVSSAQKRKNTLWGDMSLAVSDYFSQYSEVSANFLPTSQWRRDSLGGNINTLSTYHPQHWLPDVQDVSWVPCWSTSNVGSVIQRSKAF